MQNLPTQPYTAVVVHNNHGKGVREDMQDAVGCSFKNRSPHVILGFHGGTEPGVGPDKENLIQAQQWVEKLVDGVLTNRHVLSGGFAGFFPREEINVVEFFGESGAERLKHLKRRLDPHNIFSQGHLELEL